MNAADTDTDTDLGSDELIVTFATTHDSEDTRVRVKRTDKVFGTIQNALKLKLKRDDLMLDNVRFGEVEIENVNVDETFEDYGMEDGARLIAETRIIPCDIGELYSIFLRMMDKTGTDTSSTIRGSWRGCIGEQCAQDALNHFVICDVYEDHDWGMVGASTLGDNNEDHIRFYAKRRLNTLKAIVTSLSSQADVGDDVMRPVGHLLVLYAVSLHLHQQLQLTNSYEHWELYEHWENTMGMPTVVDLLDRLIVEWSTRDQSKTFEVPPDLLRDISDAICTQWSLWERAGLRFITILLMKAALQFAMEGAAAPFERTFAEADAFMYQSPWPSLGDVN